LYAAAALGRDEVVKLLLERGADPTLCGKNARSALQAAVENGFSGIAAIIRQKTDHEGCHVTLKNPVTVNP
jgi:ankyrin repeat protein